MRKVRFKVIKRLVQGSMVWKDKDSEIGSSCSNMYTFPFYICTCVCVYCTLITHTYTTCLLKPFQILMGQKKVGPKKFRNECITKVQNSDNFKQVIVLIFPNTFEESHSTCLLCTYYVFKTVLPVLGIQQSSFFYGDVHLLA